MDDHGDSACSSIGATTLSLVLAPYRICRRRTSDIVWSFDFSPFHGPQLESVLFNRLFLTPDGQAHRDLKSEVCQSGHRRTRLVIGLVLLCVTRRWSPSRSLSGDWYRPVSCLCPSLCFHGGGQALFPSLSDPRRPSPKRAVYSSLRWLAAAVAWWHGTVWAWNRKRSATNRTLQVMSDRDGTWAPALESIAHGGPGYGEGEYRWWGGWGRKIEPKRWKQQCTSPCSLRCRRYSFSPPSAVLRQDIFRDPREPSRNFDEDADDNFHAAPRLKEPEYGAKMTMDEST
ncbi:hypothetical protein CFIO01_08519 [Colletotrichum fioriniae PJ7]|uniref:Uncharacterized protein n=1 Tax=Colletotrichum fioriniae PJ7 TaxID=1445577 RepID=A0A010QJU1_9PEZI|nr:hypothetical protein CFIO01_08519 [Colletotrichum fioriniae PJ7]